jgi:hypothetical protein
VVETNECTSIAGHIDGHDNVLMGFLADRLIRQVSRYPRFHRTLPSGKYLPNIATAEKVIDFAVRN